MCTVTFGLIGFKIDGGDMQKKQDKMLGRELGEWASLIKYILQKLTNSQLALVLCMAKLITCIS